MFYIIQDVRTKRDHLGLFRKSLIGCKCYPVIVEIGQSALIEYYPHDDPEHLCRLTTTPVVSITQEFGVVKVETENTIYILAR